MIRYIPWAQTIVVAADAELIPMPLTRKAVRNLM